MNKKGIIALVIVIILVVVVILSLGKGDTSMKNDTNDTNNTGTSTDSSTTVPTNVDKSDYAPVTSGSTDTTLLGRLKKASVGVTEDGKKVALSNGKATFTVEGTTNTASVTLGDIAVEQTVDGRKDVLATVSVDLKTAVYTYVVIFEDRNGVLVDKSYGLVGQDLKVTGLRTDVVSESGDVEYVTTVTYAATATPNTKKSKFFIVEKGAFNLAKTIDL